MRPRSAEAAAVVVAAAADSRQPRLAGTTAATAAGPATAAAPVTAAAIRPAATTAATAATATTVIAPTTTAPIGITASTPRSILVLAGIPTTRGTTAIRGAMGLITAIRTDIPTPTLTAPGRAHASK